MISLLGIPYDAASSFMRGPAEGPSALRAALYSDSANSWTETGMDLGGGSAGWVDAGDLQFSPAGGTPFAGVAAKEVEQTRRAERTTIRKGVDAVLASGGRTLSIGGDHSVAYPILQAYGARYTDLTILQFDAHADLYDEFEGDRHSHACPFARIMEEGLASRLIQIGVRTLTGHQNDQRKRFSVETLGADPDVQLPDLSGPVYISLDLDVLDPAFAPGVSHHEPGGLSTRHLIRLLHQVTAPIVGADVVELNPSRDPSGLTSMVAAKLTKELLGLMVRNGTAGETPDVESASGQGAGRHR